MKERWQDLAFGVRGKSSILVFFLDDPGGANHFRFAVLDFPHLKFSYV